METLGEQLLLCFLCFILNSSAGQEDVKTLNGQVGGNITFPAQVMKLGTLIYNKNTLSVVTHGQNNIFDDRLTVRVLWDNRTGQFSVINLVREDAGVYKVDAKTKEGPVVTSYQLHVYEPVPVPTVNVSAVTAESCYLVCLLQKTGNESSMLSWYREDELLNQTSSHSLSLVVDTQHYNSSYHCVSSNPISNKTVSVTVDKTCISGNNSIGDERRFVIPLVIGLTALCLLLGVIMMVRKERDKQSKDSSEREQNEITYAVVSVVQRTDHQEGWNPSEPPANLDRSNLTTVYDKLEVHRMTPTETDIGAV